MKIFKLPDLGEGLPDAEISEWHVQVGDEVKLDQSLVSMETAKAVVEVPSPVTGRVIKLFGKPGDIIQTGSPLVEFEHGEQEIVPEKEEDRGTVAGRLETSNTVLQESHLAIAGRTQNSVKATPAIRALAQRLNVELGSVTPTGPNGTILTQDVEHAAHALQGAGPLELLKGTRRVMAQIMSQSHAEVVPVTVMDDAHLLHWSADFDITVRLIQAIVAACQQEPALNAWYDSKAVGRRLMPECNLGLAMDTTDGLFVPVIHKAEKYDAKGLRQRINALKSEVETRSILPENLRGATLTLSNFGKFAGRYASPVVVPPMVAILGVGRLREEVVAIKGEIKICSVLPLALTFDHRAVTGGEATRFLGIVIKSLESKY